MSQGIHIARIWSDDDIVELEIGVDDGTSRFVNRVYVGHSNLTETISRLRAFRTQVHGGLFDMRFGEFGCEYANGAFHARFHFFSPSKVLISCQQESEFAEFGRKVVAGGATLYLRSEPALLDRFVEELERVSSEDQGEAWLEAV